jgi:hypothetical protein
MDSRKIYDINLVAYLLAKGFTESSLPKKEKDHQFYFYFKDTPELQEEIDNYYCSQPLVSAPAYAYHLKRLRVLLSEMKEIKGRDK